MRHVSQKNNSSKNICVIAAKAIDEIGEVGYSTQATRQKRESNPRTPIRFENAINQAESIAFWVL